MLTPYREGHLDVAQKLIELGADVNSEGFNGRTAVFYAAENGRRELCEFLIKHGALVNKQDKKRQTPLLLAKKNNRHDVVDLLVNFDATPVKEKPFEKDKSTKKKGSASKKKPYDKNAPKKYVLTAYKDGIWSPLTGEELKVFIDNNKEVGAYLTDQELLNSMRIPPVNPAANIYYHWDKAATKIINHLGKQQGAWHFQQPVDPITFHIPDYPVIIKRPMDFGTIKKKLATGAYAKCQEFVEDVELVFSNCITYNGESSDFGFLAKNLREEFRKQCQLLSLDFYMSK